MRHVGTGAVTRYLLLALVASACTSGGSPDVPADGTDTGDASFDADAAPDAGDAGADADASGDADADAEASADADAEAEAEAGPPACPTATFVAPAAGATLTAADDKSQTMCASGLVYDVKLATNAPDGTMVKLFAGGGQLGTAQPVSVGLVVFPSASLPNSGTVDLRAELGRASCTATVSATVDCALHAPTCTVSKPVVGGTHPKLNGVPVAQGGDRVSSAMSPYAVAFEVATTAEDGQPVSLTLDGANVSLTASASGGLAEFPSVVVQPDGSHDVVASCVGKNGAKATSATTTYVVDTVPPDLTITQPMAGAFIGPSQDVDNNPSNGVQFRVCGATTAADATALPATLGAAQNNFCAGIGTATPTCAAVDGGGSACVTLTCPGGAPFDLATSLKDDAGNPTSVTVAQVACASSLPTIQIVSPVDGSGADPSTHLLAAGTTLGFADLDPSTPGAQANVRACTDAQTGNVTLRAGQAGGTLDVVSAAPVAVVPAQMSDGCPSALPYVATFASVTLPESAEDGTGALVTATRLVADVTDVSTATSSSPNVDVWVDSVLPTLQPAAPTPLCGAFFQTTGTYTGDFSFFTSSVPVTFSLDNGAAPAASTASAFSSAGRVRFSGVTLQQGVTNASATVTEPSGNAFSLGTPCQITVGNPPTITIKSPAANALLNVANDGDATTAGWQGTVSACIDAASLAASPTATLAFSTDVGGPLGAAAQVDGSGCVTLTGVTLPDSDHLQLQVQSSDVAGRGVGTVTETLVVDTIVPNPPLDLFADVANRRQTSFTLDWVAPADGVSPPRAVAGYDVRWSKTPIVSQADFDGATQVAYATQPAAPGSADGAAVVSLFIENDYYFAVASTDKAGNRSTFTATTTPTRATFQTATLTSDANALFGYAWDGQADFNNDGYADLLVGAGASNKALIFFGSANGPHTTPDITLQGSTLEFGVAANVIGDIDSDGKLDVAIGSDVEQKVYVFLGKTLAGAASYPATFTTAQASLVVGVDTTADTGFNGALFGTPVARIGDFNGDGADDFAIGGAYYANSTGYVAIVFGVPAGTPLPSSVSFPAALSAGTGQAIVGAATGGRFGTQVFSLAGYSATTGSTLLVSAPRLNGSAGRVYQINGPIGASKLNLATASAAATFDGAVNSRFGTSIATVGRAGGSGGPAVLLASPGVSGAATGAAGSVTTFSGLATNGIFSGTSFTVTSTAASNTTDRFGFFLEGGGFSGATNTVSFLGDGTADVVVAGVHENGGVPVLYVVDGRKLFSSADVSTLVDVKYPLPTGWSGTYIYGSALRDVDNDGYGDIVVSDIPASLAGNGRVLVLW